MNQNDARWELIGRCRDGQGTPAEIQQLESQLRSDASFRQAWVRVCNLDAALELAAAEFDRDNDSIPAASPAQGDDRKAPARRVTGWLRRPSTAAAAGLVVGIFSASLVFAIVTPRSGAGRVSLLHESFEDPSFASSAGFPQQSGRWTGGPVRVTPGKGNIQPADGARMLQLEPVADNLFNRLYYVRDLQRHPLPAGVRQVQLTASFRPEVTDEKSRYLLRAASFSQDLAAIEPRWMTDLWSELDERALARAARGVPRMPGADGWQTLSITVDVPANARILIVSLWAATMDGKPENRHPHYLDNVWLSGIPQETTP